MKYLRERMAFLAGMATGVISLAAYMPHVPRERDIEPAAQVRPQSQEENVLSASRITAEDAVQTLEIVAKAVVASYPLARLWESVYISQQCSIPEWRYSEALGSYNNGKLLDALMLENSPCVLANKENRYGTWELLSTLTKAARSIHATYRLPLEVYDLSKKDGGRFPPHVSHQNGLDADVALLYFDEHAKQYRTGQFLLSEHKKNEKTWDANWHFIRLLQGPTKVVFWQKDYIGKLREHVLRHYGIEEWERYGLILQDWKDHAGHFHVRVEKPDMIAGRGRHERLRT